MRLFYYDKFLESYSKLPKQIQKKVQDFVQKFRLESTLHSIHFEPIHNFKDPQLRTARVDQKYRAIIHAPKEGDVYHLLWVDSHDEAMTWAQNKVIEWNRNTQSYQVYEYKDSPLQKNVASISDKSLFGAYTDEQLVEIGVPAPLMPSVRIIKDLNDLEALEKYIPREAFESIYYLLDGLGIEQIIKDIQDGKAEVLEQSLQLNSPNNQRNFFEVKDDKDIAELLSGDLSKWKKVLHPTQRIVVETSVSGSFKLTGGAGTGKTVAAIHRLKHLAEHCNGPKSIFFTTFTKSLIYNLRSNIQALNVDESKYSIDNIHSFIIHNAKSLNIIPDDARIFDFQEEQITTELWNLVTEKTLSQYDIEFLKREYEDVVLLKNVKTLKEYFTVSRVGREKSLGRKERIEIWNIFEVLSSIKADKHLFHLDEVTNKLYEHYKAIFDKPFIHIIADEIQDFSIVELRLLRALVPEGKDDLFLVGDPLQKIYNRVTNFSQAGINIKGKKSRRLKINYRTTEEIKRLGLSVIQNISYDDFDGQEELKQGYVSILKGIKPTYEVLSNSTDAQQRLIEIIESLSEHPAGAIKYQDVCVAFRTKKELNETKKVLHIGKLSYYDVTTQVGDIKGIRLSTFHNLKGMEYKVVILYGVSSSSMPLKPSDYDSLSDFDKKIVDKRERALFYVAMTRAIQQLYVIGHGGRTEYLS